MTGKQIVRWPVNVVFRPSSFVNLDPDQEAANTLDALTSAVRLLGFYFVNLLLYALPLTLAGFGIRDGAATPHVVTSVLSPLGVDPHTVWQFSSALVTNSAFLLLATILTFGTFHVGLILTRSSKGAIRSLHAVSYSSGIYLAVMFSTVVYLSTESGLAVAEEFLLWLQTSFIQFFIDLVGADLVPPVEASRPELAAMTTLEQAVLTVLLLSAVYFLYVLYVGARTVHDATRFEALVATGFVLLSPALYVLGTIYLTMGAL
ncbi:hypothetical protein [Halobiforma nitratireducens]|uniref:Yip1 domain-containing protein n=1 Tax=Halobiforma nitratireducens JCM 10879 TaxID=1227454 RepID=M0LWK7_9EURY|nr:hypothetical protein [Halobiforma nitratireducens]EMA37856.1 hypothetical protein C446_10535 [Halobiforma nitratireducens JCM 10879]